MLKVIKTIFKENNPILTNEFKKTFPIYALGMLVNGIQATFHFIIPLIIGEILDLVLQNTASTEEIMSKAYLLILVSAISLVPRTIYRFLFFTCARTSDTKLRKETIRYLQYVKPEYYEKEEKGVFLAYISKELLSIRKFLGNFFYNIGRLILNPAVVLAIMGLKYSMKISISLLPILIIIAILIFKEYKKLNKKIEEARKADIELFKVAEQNTSGFLLIKLYNEQENQIKKFKEINKKISETSYNIGVEKNKISNLTNIMYAVCYITVFGISLLSISKGTLTIGALTALTTCTTFVLSEITQAIQPLIEGIAYFKQSTKRYNYFLGLETYKKDGQKLEKIEKVTIKNLSYTYDKSNYALKDINLELKRGEKIGIIGQIGSGKTTLMNVLVGFLEVPEGHVYINDIDVNKYSREEIFKNISYTTQENIILDDTIENNINIVKEEKLDIKKLTSLSCLNEDVERMENKLKTVIGERGNRLSGGQKQRIQIARSLSSVREINIFDDTLSALDSETEEKVLNTIIEETKDKTLIIVSNKISNIQNLDKVYMIINGEIYAKRNTKRTIRK